LRNFAQQGFFAHWQTGFFATAKARRHGDTKHVLSVFFVPYLFSGATFKFLQTETFPMLPCFPASGCEFLDDIPAECRAVRVFKP
jgi:hypothetical protein